jgi:hypothetical protein
MVFLVVMTPPVPEYGSSLQRRVLDEFYNVLDLVSGVNRLKRGGSLFEGIVQREMAEYIIRKNVCAVDFPSSGGVPIWGALQSTTKSSLRDT